jgi:hypothetical protein
LSPLKKNLTALGPSLLLAIRTRYSWYGYCPSKTARTSANAWKGLNGEAISTLKWSCPDDAAAAAAPPLALALLAAKEKGPEDGNSDNDDEEEVTECEEEDRARSCCPAFLVSILST